MERTIVTTFMLIGIVFIIGCAACKTSLPKGTHFTEISANELQSRMEGDKSSSLVLWHYAGKRDGFQCFIRQAGPTPDFFSCFKVKEPSIIIAHSQNYSDCQEKWLPTWWGAISLREAEADKPVKK